MKKSKIIFQLNQKADVLNFFCVGFENGGEAAKKATPGSMF